MGNFLVCNSANCQSQFTRLTGLPETTGIELLFSVLNRVQFGNHGSVCLGPENVSAVP